MARQVTIDLNARSKNGWIRVRTRLLRREARVGELVEITDIDRTMTGEAELAEIDREKGLAYLNVDWTEFHALPDEVTSSEIGKAEESTAVFSRVRLDLSGGVTLSEPSSLVLSGNHLAKSGGQRRIHS